MVHGQRQFLQSEQNELQHRCVVAGLGVSQPRVQKLVTPDSNESEMKLNRKMSIRCRIKNIFYSPKSGTS